MMQEQSDERRRTGACEKEGEKVIMTERNEKKNIYIYIFILVFSGEECEETMRRKRPQPRHTQTRR